MQKWIPGSLGSIGAVLLATAVAWAAPIRASSTMTYQYLSGAEFLRLPCSG